ncbi:HAD-IA family hydrolase [Hankyongella ginsenosidimutans]|uniref:HAD family hydrolase n=1 Tax=Hankyongella ginsenosidimutans TaxID=1763828 RepID=UPI003CCC6952
MLETELEPIAGIPQLLAMLQAEGRPLAVASNSRLNGVRRSLRITGLTQFFGDRIATADQVAQPKPAPDVYLMAAGLLEAEPASCLAIEDSPTGVRAARAAGMTVIAFTDPAHAFGRQRLADAGTQSSRICAPSLDCWSWHERAYRRRGRLCVRTARRSGYGTRAPAQGSGCSRRQGHGAAGTRGHEHHFRRPRDAVDTGLAALRALPGCAGFTPRESLCATMPFGLLKVKVKREIVTLGVESVDPVNRVGTYVPPATGTPCSTSRAWS